MHRVEVSLKPQLPDPRGLGLVKDIHDLRISGVSDARVSDIYWLDGDISQDEIDLICRAVFVDPVTQDYCSFYNDKRPSEQVPEKNLHNIEVAQNAGVIQPIEDTIMKAIRDVRITGIKAVKTSTLYQIRGKLNQKQLDAIASRLLVNPIIQHVAKPGESKFRENPQYVFKLNEVDILSGDKAILAAVKALGFNDVELQSIIEYFSKLGRKPTDAELETLAQTWSEHCVHKTFKDPIKFTDKTVDNLLKSTIIKATRELNKPWCLTVFEDNAGVIDFDGRWAICFKVETHNHPSAVEPYGGAATGIGGVVRDPLGTGLGAKPILNTDVFCFAPPDYPHEKLPKGVLHPRRIFKGVRAGVADYGNRLGIPTANGAVLFDERYLANPLVYCGTLGIMPAEISKKQQHQPGDLVVVIGGKTGRDGIHGVTFASEELTDKSGDVSYSSVQIGNAIVEKKVIDVLLQAREKKLYRRITDVGGGGLSSAVGEMGADTGVRVYLDRVPLKYAGITYSEIWVSESQERMLLAVPPETIKEFLALCASEDVEATVIGEFTDDHKLRLYYHHDLVCELNMDFLHNCRPKIERPAVWEPPKNPEPDFKQPRDLSKTLMQILGSWNVCSKEWVIRQYDHEVQGGSVLKPLVGKTNDGPGDAAIIKPVLDSEMGVIVSNGINPNYSDVDPYWMAAAAIDEALRQIIAVGGDLKKVALLDNFCWGNTNRPEMLGALTRAAQACHDMSLAYGTPFVSGKDSLNNEFNWEGKIIAIPHTLLVSAMGVMDDVNKAVSMDFKQAGDLIYIVGATFNELGGSEYLKTRKLIGNSVPKVNAQSAKELMDRLSNATAKGLAKACHDLSEGGIGVAAAEMAFAGGLGAKVYLKDVPLGEVISRNDYILFSESNSRFLVEISPENQAAFEAAMQGSVFAGIGQVNDSQVLEVYGVKGRRLVKAPISKLKEAWQKPLRW